MPDIQIAQLTRWQDVEALQPEWSALWQQHPHATPFQSPEWLLPWWRHLGGGDLFFLTLRSDGQLVGVAPLFMHEWEGRRQLSPMGVSISDYSDFLILSSCDRAGTALILEHLEALREWEVIVLPDLAAGSPMLTLPFPSGLQARIEPSSICPVIRLPPTPEDYERCLPAKRRRNIKRGWRWLAERGGADVEWATGETLGEHMNALFLWHAARWRVREQTGVLATPALQSFHQEAARGLLQVGALWLLSLRHGGTLRSVLYGFAQAGRAYAYLTGFDPAIAAASPGQLLLAHAANEAIRQGYGEFDLLRGDEPHKFVWTAVARQNYCLVVTRHTSRA